MRDYLSEIEDKVAINLEFQKYLGELSKKVTHSSEAVVSVTSVIDRLLDLYNLLPPVEIDGDSMAKSISSAQ
jgi:phage-related holin